MKYCLISFTGKLKHNSTNRPVQLQLFGGGQVENLYFGLVWRKSLNIKYQSITKYKRKFLSKKHNGITLTR